MDDIGRAWDAIRKLSVDDQLILMQCQLENLEDDEQLDFGLRQAFHRLAVLSKLTLAQKRLDNHMTEQESDIREKASILVTKTWRIYSYGVDVDPNSTCKVDDLLSAINTIDDLIRIIDRLDQA